MIDINHKKILLVRNDNIGDLICTTPAIEALRKKYPNNQIDIIVNSYNFSAINNNPFIDRIYCYTKPKHKHKFSDKLQALLGKLKIFWQIKQKNYDVVVIFRSGYSKSAELFSRITSAQYKVGVKNPKGNDDFNIYVEQKENQHEVEFCFACLQKFGVEHSGENTRYFVDKHIIEKYNQYKDCVAFHISARMKKNQINYHKLYQIINSIKLDKILITADPKDFNLAEKLTESINNAIVIRTKSFYDLGGLISNLKLFITLEGGAMHLSPALGIKTIALFGVSNINRWHPWGYKNLVLQDSSKIANNINMNLIVNTINNEI
jgi:ADP-heptose:LPS heptosyltransferase